MAISIEQIYAAIDKHKSEFEAEARACEIARRPTQALAHLMRETQIPMSKVPKTLGGCEISPAQQIDLFARLAYCNPTAAWIGFNYSGVAGMIGACFSDAGIDTIFQDGKAPLIAAVSAPTGNATQVAAGYTLSGYWRYASGATCADYVFLMAICDNPTGPLGMLVPVNQVELIDDWHVAALQGTGSLDVKVDDLFVPKKMTGSPLNQLRGGSQFFRMGYRGYVGGENFGFTLGVAQRLVDETARLAKTKKRVLEPTPIGDRGAFRQTLARTDAALRASRAYLMSELDRAEQICDGNQQALSMQDRAQIDAAISYATETTIQACTQLVPYAGAGALHLDHPIQRALRDVIGSGQHLVATSESLDHWGSALLQAAD